tara:strand:+ start:1628 stop:1996 length:369 start_codon:yes stop_codon:yes gene_type:complete
MMNDCSGIQIQNGTKCLINFLLKSSNSNADLRNFIGSSSCNPNAENSSGMTPLKAAVMNGDEDTIDILVGHGATIDEETIEFAKKKYPHKKELNAYLQHAYLKKVTNSPKGAPQKGSRRCVL